MDILDEAILKVWEVFEKNKLRYIMIGGFAVNLHGFHRFTGDIDIYLEDTLENRIALRKSFLELELGDFPQIETIEFVAGWTEFSLTKDVTLDIMTAVLGLENITFQECYDLASIAEIEKIKVPFLHLNQLIAAKKASNRPKDQIDLIELEKIKSLRNIK